MEYNNFIKKIEEEYAFWLESEFGEPSIVVETDSSEYIINDGSMYVGGEKGTLMCDLLGNVSYDNIGTLADDLYNYITKSLNGEITDVRFE